MAMIEGAQVRRSDLIGSPQSSRASSPDLDTLERLGANLQFEVVDKAFQPIETVENLEDEEEELEFQLFAPTKSTTDASTPAPAAQKIRIRSPSEELREPGIVGLGRPLSYYHTGQLDPVRAKEFEIAAVTGADVVAMKEGQDPKTTEAGCYQGEKEEEGKSKEEKERLEREKKARRNREKKFKKRARDKAKKAAGKDGDDADAADDGSDSDSDADVEMTS
ncbi:unnamed protein product [Aureobasidium pullulans]|nr:unnamed protein product [Aureobasidium pullulans]